MWRLHYQACLLFSLTIILSSWFVLCLIPIVKFETAMSTLTFSKLSAHPPILLLGLFPCAICSDLHLCIRSWNDIKLLWIRHTSIDIICKSLGGETCDHHIVSSSRTSSDGVQACVTAFCRLLARQFRPCIVSSFSVSLGLDICRNLSFLISSLATIFSLLYADSCIIFSLTSVKFFRVIRRGFDGGAFASLVSLGV